MENQITEVERLKRVINAYVEMLEEKTGMCEGDIIGEMNDKVERDINKPLGITDVEKENRKDQFVTDEDIERDEHLFLLMQNFRLMNPELTCRDKAYMDYEEKLYSYTNLKLANMVLINC